MSSIAVIILSHPRPYIYANLTEVIMHSLPPGLPIVQGHPLIQLIKWTFQPLEFLEECERRYGSAFAALLGNNRPSLFFSHPEAIADIFSPGNSSLLDSGRAQPMLEIVLGKNSTILLDGQEHRRHRKLIMPPLHGERMRSYGDIICQITEQITQSWVPGQAIILHPCISDITFQVILKTIFGLRGTACDEELSQYVRKFIDSFNSPLLYFLAAVFPILQKDLGPRSPGGQYVQQIQALDKLMFNVIRERRADLDPSRIDMLTMLMLAKDENGESLSDVELRDELLSLLFAGFDTTSTVTCWALYFIHHHPAVKERLLTELDSLGEKPAPNEIAKLPYLNAVCSESLRLRSSVPCSTARIASEPMKIGGYEFSPELQFVPAQHLTHHRPDIYPDPYRFNPDRFLSRQYSSSEYYPYGGGARLCAGAAFASYEMKLIIATLLRKYQMELVDKAPIKTVRRGVNIVPKGGVKITLKSLRTNPQTSPALTPS
jgi:cytochrome P450 family 110